MIENWNYRICRQEFPHIGETAFIVIEAYYDLSGNVTSWAEAIPYGDTLEELRDDLIRMLKATTKPILFNRELPGYD